MIIKTMYKASNFLNYPCSAIGSHRYLHSVGTFFSSSFTRDDLSSSAYSRSNNLSDYHKYRASVRSSFVKK